MSDQDTLQHLVDRQAIQEKIYQYCRAVDRLDIALGHSIWHDNSVADYGEFYYGEGPGVIDLICKQHEQTLYHSHQVTNIIINLNGDLAGSESYVTANLRVQQGDSLLQMTVWSRYIDSWSRRHGRWAIDRRKTVVDFDEIRETTPLSKLESDGLRNSNDPSYHVLSKEN